MQLWFVDNWIVKKEWNTLWECFTDDLVSLKIEDSLYLDTFWCCWCKILIMLVANSSYKSFSRNHLIDHLQYVQGSLYQASLPSKSLIQLKWLLSNSLQEESATNGVVIIHQQHLKVSRYSGYFICKDTRSSVQHFHKCYTFLQVDYLQITPAFNKPLIFYRFQINLNPSIQQASYRMSISEQYTAQYSTILWLSINFRAIYSPSFNKPLIFYQFQSKIQTSIQQSCDILSTSEQYTTQSLVLAMYP